MFNLRVHTNSLKKTVLPIVSIRNFILLVFFTSISFTFGEPIAVRQLEPTLLKLLPPKYHKVPATPGDGAYSLLRRYRLADHYCNVQQFFKINQLSEGEGLRVGRYYAIPVYLYNYNGTSIRSTIGNPDLPLAKRIQKYNEIMLADGFRKKAFQDDRRLWVPYHELNCPDTDIEYEEILVEKETEEQPARTVKGARVFPIFGKKYQHTPLKNNALRGKVFYIVSGHGGPDPGAIGKQKGHSLCEDEYAYDVALRLVRRLIEHGATAYMIVRDENDGIRDDYYLDCDKDETVWGGEAVLHGQKARLFQRSDMINELYDKHKRQGVTYQRTIVIHIDSRSRRQQTDLFFYHQSGSASGRKFANKLHQTIQKKYAIHRKKGQYHGTVTGRDLHMLRETKTIAAYIELGNIQHAFDQKRVVLPSNRDALANWLCESLLK